VSKSSVKKEKNMKDKTRVAEAGSQNSAAVDDSSKTAVDGSKNEKSKDPACAHGVSSQPSSDKSELCELQLTSQQTSVCIRVSYVS